MTKTSLLKPALYLSLFSASYFALAFTKSFEKINSNFVAGLYEFLTIPLIILQFFLLAFSVYQLFVKRNNSIFSLVIFILSVAICLGLFLVN